MDKTQKHMEICEKLNDIYRRKNADYGDSFSKARNEIPYYTLGKLFDKYSRLRQLFVYQSKGLVSDETVEDTLMDLANYAIMELIERIAEKEAQND